MRRVSCFASLALLALAVSFGADASAQQPQQPQPAGAQTGVDQGGLRFIDNPGGGRVVFGHMTGHPSMATAMAYLLQRVHQHFGEKPQIGRFFEAKGGGSVATFFTVTARNQGNKPIAGMAIVSMPTGQSPSGAVMFDEAARFRNTQPQLMGKLTEAWRASAPRTASAGSSQPAPAPATPPPASGSHVALRMSTMGDRSATIGLAPGWRLTSVGGGGLTAEGANGEQIGLGLMIQNIHDRGVQNLPGVAPIICPGNADLWNTFICAVNQHRQANNLPANTYRLVTSQNDQATQYEQRVLQVTFEVDGHDGKGVRKGDARIGQMITRGSPYWAMTISSSNAPTGVYATSWPVMQEMLKTYSQDGRVIAQETQVVIAKINANAAATRAQSQAIAAATDAQINGIEQQRRDQNAQAAARSQRSDDQDRQSQVFSNYLLDRSVVRDNDQAARGTIDNNYADALVQANPDRFTIVQNQDMIRGLDY